MIRPKAVAVFRHQDRLLISFARDPETGQRYGRLLGGGIELGERADAALRREIREELGAEVGATRLLGVVENLFDWSGQRFHEIVFVFEATFADVSMYARDAIPVAEAVCDGPAVWVSAAAVVDGTITVYPNELRSLIA